MKLKNRISRLDKQMRELRCAWCAYSLFDVPPPLSFVPNMESDELSVLACCWRCGTRFNVAGDSLRDRQLNALFYSTHPAKVYTEERARAMHTFIVSRYILARKVAGQENKDEGLSYQEQRQKQEDDRLMKEKMQASLSPKARIRIAMSRNYEAQATAEYAKLRKRLGESPRDMDGKTFAELEIIIFGDASDEAHALDGKAAQFESDLLED